MTLYELISGFVIAGLALVVILSLVCTLILIISNVRETARQVRTGRNGSP